MIERKERESKRYHVKHVGIVKISDPTAVESKLSSMSTQYQSGGIFCSCPEIGMDGVDLIYCRYGLSVPYYKVKNGDKLWIEPTIGQTERWIYTGFVDCGRDAISPTDDDEIIILNDAGKMTLTIGGIDVEIDGTANTIKIGTGGEHIVLGDTLKTELQKNITALTTLQTAMNAGWVVNPGDGGAALKSALAGFFALTFADLTNILSTVFEVEQ